jgi:hypothetical protein
MAFNNVGFFSLDSGSSGRYWLTRNDGEDFGAQWIMAHPIGPGTLEVSAFAKEHRIAIPNRLVTLYWVTVTNIGGDIALFSLSGGGNI